MVVANGYERRKRKHRAEFDGCGCFDTAMYLIDIRDSLIYEGAGFIIVITVELRAIPEMRLECGNAAANDGVVELIGEVIRYAFLRSGIKV